MHDALSSWGDALGLGVTPALEPMQMLYANLMGSVVVAWAALRLVRPLPVHGLFDGIARVLFTAWQTYAVTHGATGILWLFLGVEVTLGVIQLTPWFRRTSGLLSPRPTRT